MQETFDPIPELMNSLAGARASLKVCLSSLPKGVEAGQQRKADALRRRIVDAIKEIEVSRLKVLKGLMAEIEAEETGRV